jgi:hypothetical protein
MRTTSKLTACLLALLIALLVAPAAMAQVAGLYYKEVEKDGRIYIFNTPERYKSFEASGGDMGTNVTLVNRGPNGETLVAENETAMDLYLFKHNLDAYDRPTPKPAAGPGAYPSTKIGGRVFADASTKENKDKFTGLKSSDSGEGVDVKRFYFTLTHEFDAMWSAQFQSDIGDQGSKRYDVFVKKAYVQARLSPEAIFRLGSADTPWVPFVENLYGYRYVEQVVTDRLSFGTSADWGVHFLGKAGNDILGYQFSVLNGKGYSNPTRTGSVDYEGRVSLEPVKGFTLGVGGYSGKRGNDVNSLTAPVRHTAQRLDGVIAYASDRFRVGGEYFEAKNWNNVTTIPTDKADGYSLWGSVGITPAVSLFGRYDDVKPSKDLKPNLKDTYYNAGVQWRFNKVVAASLVYKNEEVKAGTLSTGNGGTVGSTNAGSKGEFSEFGLYVLYDF